MLSYETIHKIIALLENGFSRRKIARLADVSVSTVQRIADGKYSNNHSEPATSRTSESFSLNLHGDTFRRYLDIRHNVEEQVLAGKRTPLENKDNN